MKLLPPEKTTTLTRKKKPAASAIPLSFLLGCSQSELSNFELAKLSTVANLRGELLQILDKMIEDLTQAALAAWFKTTDRETLKQAIENPEDIIAWAKKQIRNKGKSKKEIEEELIPFRTLPPGAAHLAGALRYTARNLAEGKCAVCPQPLDRNSVRFCTTHLAHARDKYREKSKKLSKPPQGHAPGTLAALAKINAERARKKNRKASSVFGIPTKTLVG